MKICSIVMLEVLWVVMRRLPSKHPKKSSWYPSLDTPCTRAYTVRTGSSVNSLDTPCSRGLGVGSRDSISSEVSSWSSEDQGLREEFELWFQDKIMVSSCVGFRLIKP